MATSYGTYSDFSLKFDPMNPLCQWDNHEYECKKCSKLWIGGTTCFVCHPQMLAFSLPRKEYLEVNKYDGDIPKVLEMHWKKHDKKEREPFNISDVISGMKEQSRAFRCKGKSPLDDIIVKMQKMMIE